MATCSATNTGVPNPPPTHPAKSDRMLNILRVLSAHAVFHLHLHLPGVPPTGDIHIGGGMRTRRDFLKHQSPLESMSKACQKKNFYAPRVGRATS